MIWMITLHKQFVKSFLEGEKEIELRTRIPKMLRPGDIIVVAQSGTHNKVVMRMTVESIIKLSPSGMFEKYYKEIQLNWLAYEDYTKGREWVYGLKTCQVIKFDDELYTTDYGIKRAPQWFREVKYMVENLTIIELKK